MVKTAREDLEVMLAHHQALSDGVAERVTTVREAVQCGAGSAAPPAVLIAYLADQVLPHAVAEEKSIYRAAGGPGRVGAAGGHHDRRAPGPGRCSATSRVYRFGRRDRRAGLRCRIHVRRPRSERERGDPPAPRRRPVGRPARPGGGDAPPIRQRAERLVVGYLYEMVEAGRREEQR